MRIKTKLNARLEYGKGLISLRLNGWPITKLAFLRARATLKENTIKAPKI